MYLSLMQYRLSLHVLQTYGGLSGLWQAMDLYLSHIVLQSTPLQSLQGVLHTDFGTPQNPRLLHIPAFLQSFPPIYVAGI